MPALRLWLLLLLALCCLVTAADAHRSREAVGNVELNPIVRMKNYMKRLESRLNTLEAEVQASRVREESLLREVELQKSEIQTLKTQTSQCTKDLRTQRELINELFTQVKAKQDEGVAETNESSTGALTHQEEKRADDSWLRTTLSNISQQQADMMEDIQSLKTSDSQQDAAIAVLGTTYTRWGSKSCPRSAETVYTSIMGGSWYSHSGAAANYLCLSPDPVFDNKPVPANSKHALLFGAEYDTPSSPNLQFNAVCSVCRIPRSSTLMIPGTNRCSPGWTLEYSGYLMAGWPTSTATEYICVDAKEEFVYGTQANDNGRHLGYTVTRCGSLHCPPYINNRVVLCAVCSK